MNKPNLFDYNDFRRYLGDHYTWRHGQDHKFTRSVICRHLGLPNSRSYFTDVLNGKFVSQLKVPQFIKLLELTKEEAQYFRVLVNFNQAVDDPDDRELLFDQLVSLNRTPYTKIEGKQYAYYREWYHSAMRALLSIVDFAVNGNYRTLAGKLFPPITESQARSSVKFLSELGLIAANDHGFLKPTDKVITTGAFARDELIRQYQLKALAVAREAILKNKGEPQRVITKMISVSEQAYRRIAQRLDKFNKEVTSIVHKDEISPDKVYQLCLLLFPQSKNGASGRG